MDSPDFLTILGKLQPRPKTLEQFLRNAATTLARLVQEADDGEVVEANRRLRDSLPEEMLINLPLDLFRDPRTPLALMLSPAVEGSRLHEWKQEAKSLLGSQSMPSADAREIGESLTLESFLSPLL